MGKEPFQQSTREVLAQKQVSEIRGRAANRNFFFNSTNAGWIEFKEDLAIGQGNPCWRGSKQS